MARTAAAVVLSERESLVVLNGATMQLDPHLKIVLLAATVRSSDETGWGQDLPPRGEGLGEPWWPDGCQALALLHGAPALL